ncbi:hypothetical protein CORC01_13991 [Colletotrichum orchidophilum]|uniref:Uncharacterized protein n=1 Tax=Colletotrichum orchidophilum TaxID=1209926 RepID=A0A1G4ANG0_9PEZI|nr:uncharacterized protein CORC01_13991 [Colletotrichum orchidophilum]OHE90709.1 hypothetical protein CORC01_13991 [Colletotrichum orchidophilum]
MVFRRLPWLKGKPRSHDSSSDRLTDLQHSHAGTSLFYIKPIIDAIRTNTLFCSAHFLLFPDTHPT